jgi:hypothetical protein
MYVRNATILAGFALLFAVMISALATPERHPGDLTCADAGPYAFSSPRLSPSGAGLEASLPAGLSVQVDDVYLNFTSDFAIGAVIVKGGADSHIYRYDPPTTQASDLHAPADDFIPALEHFTFCWNMP